MDPEILRRARDEKLAAAQEKLARKAASVAAVEAKRLEKLEKGRLPPTEMFRANTEEFSAWDDKGLPTKDKEGLDLPKSKAKKLSKEWDAQKK